MSELSLTQSLCKIETQASSLNAIYIVEDLYAHPFFKKRCKISHKGDFGHLLLIGGSAKLAGAIKMSAEAALRCGTGLVAVACDKDNRDLILSTRPELMVNDYANLIDLKERLNWANAIGLGPGLGRDEFSRQIYLAIKNNLNGQKIILDADALYWLAKDYQESNELMAQYCIITPHNGEAARLLNCDISYIEQNRELVVKKLAKQYKAVAVLKGANSLISNGSDVFKITAGNPGMATAGMGDVLTGVISALLAQGLSELDAAILGVWIHALAGDRAALAGQKGLLATDLYFFLRQIINKL